MKVLIACEFSGVVREAFTLKGHDAWSCDILDSEIPGNHLKCDVLTILDQDWDLMIAFPPCTHLAISGAAWFEEKRKDGRQQQGIDFFMSLINAPIKRICVENPVGIMSKLYMKPTQVIQPWMFGHGETKATCLWLKNLPPLLHTEIVTGRVKKSFYTHRSKRRGLERSRTPIGIAKAMADQWGRR